MAITAHRRCQRVARLQDHTPTPPSRAHLRLNTTETNMEHYRYRRQPAAEPRSNSVGAAASRRAVRAGAAARKQAALYPLHRR